MPIPNHIMKVPKADEVTIGRHTLRTLPFKRLYKAVKKKINDDDLSAEEFIKVYRKSPNMYEESRLDLSESGGNLRDQFFVHDLMDGPNGATLGSSNIDAVLLYMMHRYKNREKMAHEALHRKGRQWENIALRIFGCNESENFIIYDYLFSEMWPNSFDMLSYRLLCVMNGVPDRSRLDKVKTKCSDDDIFLPDVVKSYNQLFD